MNKDLTQHTRKSSLFSTSHREKNPSDPQPQTPSLKPKGSFSSSRGDVTATSTQKIPEEIQPIKLPQETSNTPRLQSASLKSPMTLKQHKRSISDAHLKIHPDKPRDLKSTVSPRLVKERASTLKKLVEPSIICNQGPTESSMTVTRSRKNSQNQIQPDASGEVLAKRSSNPEAKGKAQDQQDAMKPLKGIIFQDVRKKSVAQEKASETPKSKPATTQNTPKHSFTSLLSKHKHGDYSPKVSARTAAVKDNSPRKRSSNVGWGNNEPKKGIKAHDKGLSMGQMYIFSTEVGDKEDKEVKEKESKEDKDTPVNRLQAAFAGNKANGDKKKTKNTEEEKPKQPVAAKNGYERTLESDLANYKIMLDSNKQTFDFEKMMMEMRKARQEQGGAMFTNMADPVVKRQGQPHRKSLDIGGINKNRFIGEACLSAKLVNPSEREPMSSGNRPATCSTPRVEVGKGGDNTGSSKENEDFEKLEKLLEAQEKAGEL